jgi:UDP-N-acetylmuramate: L-alanyl-gamma-D-glutamyl-meso-diaminopimelate ligase
VHAEPRSNTMRLGVHRDTLAASLAGADQVWLYAPPDLGWDAGGVIAGLGGRGHVAADIDALAADLARASRPGDHVLIMSNGGFGGLHGRLLTALAQAEERHGD